MYDIVSPKIYQLLQDAVAEEIDNYSITLGDPNKKGEGYIGDMYFLTLKHKSNSKTFDLVIKRAFTDERIRNAHPIKAFFSNEIYFYDKVWPAFAKFQKEALLTNIFDKIPKCFITCNEEPNEALILENIKLQNFLLLDKRKAIDEKHFEFIFRQYGKLHAVSIAYKTLNPEEYLKISQGLDNLFLVLAESRGYCDYVNYLHKECLATFDPVEDAKLIEIYKKYIECEENGFLNSCMQKDDHSVVLHGDCWSNNMMFKYDDSGAPIDLRLLDFQFAYRGNPVSDLSYCLYAGGSKEIFDKLDYFLKVYIDSLTEALEQAGCSLENAFSLEELKQDWKQYCKLGFTMSFVLWRGKAIDDRDAINIAEIDDNGDNYIKARFDEKLFKRMTREIVVHMYENDFL